MDGVNLESPEAKTLRALQRYDEVQPSTWGRAHLMEAQTILGKTLGLACTGVDEGGGFYAHDGDTCPIHEWLVSADAEKVEEEARLARALPRL